mgnify:CR=1 FL=1
MTPVSGASIRRKPVVAIVDDDPAMRASLVDLLDSAGCLSMAFDSAEQFMAADAARTIDLVITDIQMGQIGGLDLLVRLRAILPVPVPVIVITALPDERLERRAVTSGCFAFLRKPFDPETLLGYVRAAVTRP